MAVDSPVLINDWYVGLRAYGQGSLGSTHLNPSPEQIHNATKIWNELKAQGYSDAAAAGVLGNMQAESGLSPGAIQTTYSSHMAQLPDGGQHLSDLTNDVMLEWYNHSNLNQKGYGTGLIQWDACNNNPNYPPKGNQITSFAIRYGYDWYDGDMQLYRLLVESQNTTGTYWYRSNVQPPMSWDDFKNFTGTPERASDIFRLCRERGGDSSIQVRRDNAKYWYNYFGGTPDPPEPPTPGPEPPEPEPPDPPEPPSDPDWVWGEDWADQTISSFDPDVTGVPIPYSQMDCIQFVDAAWNLISVVSLNGWTLGAGTNSLWRSTATFNTSPPSDPSIYPTPVLWWKGTIDEYINVHGQLPVGCLLFHKIPEDGSPPIPPQYAGDGIGNFVHVGIYCGNGYVMQSGGQDAGGIPGGGVHKSKYNKSAWNYMALVCWVDPTGEQPIIPTFDLVTFLSMWYSTKRKDVYKRVKRSI